MLNASPYRRFPFVQDSYEHFLLITETDDLYMLQASAMPLTDKIQAPYFLL